MYNFLYIISFLLSLCLIIIGIFIQENYPLISSTITTIGGALFGSFVAIIVTRNIEINIIELVKNALIPTCFANEDEIKLLKRKWYYYYKTQQNNNIIWKCAIVDFKKSTGYGNLVVKQTIYDVEYTYTFIIKKDKVILSVESTISDEGAYIHIYPTLKLDYQKQHAGTLILQDWDMKKAYVPSIISKNPVLNIKKVGTIDDKVQQNQLQTLWDKLNIYDIRL